MQCRDQLNLVGVKKIIAFSGGSSEALESKVLEIVEQSMNELKGLPLAILTGGTKWGLPKYATQLAKKYGLPTIGVYPTRGVKYVLNDLDFAVEVDSRYGESEWGDETEIFAKLVDAVEVIGGGAGTLIELSHIFKINDRKLNKNLEPIYIAPVILSGLKSAADIAYDFPVGEHHKIVLPQNKIVDNGQTAAKFLIEKLALR